MIKRIVKYLANNSLRRLTNHYLSKPRIYRHDNLKLIIPPGVFHPAFFFSSKFLLAYIENLSLNNKTFLELGAGSGLISLFAQKKGAIVTATDINATAVANLEQNSKSNNAKITIILSDLFNNIPLQKFDIIAINPPYYKKHPTTEAEHAWYCGENGEYFNNLFSGLATYIHPYSDVLMVLSDECDIEMIQNAARCFDFNLKLEKKKRITWEEQFIYKAEYSGW